MKKIATTFLFFYLILISTQLFSQQKCKVLVPAIAESYHGKCKKGLANGKGIANGIDTYEGRFTKGYPNGLGVYTWASGNEYRGEWEFGKRTGKGNYKFKYNGKDSIQTGIWKNDIYMGPIPPPPSIIQSRNIQQYSFLKLGDNNKFSLEIFMNGTTNSTIENLSIASSFGSYQNIGDRLVFDYMEYPVTMKITYVTNNKFHSAKLDVVFEFEISEPGNWVLKLTN